MSAATGNACAPTNANVGSVPWTQRYAPRTLAQVKHQEAVVRSLTAYVSNVPQSAFGMPHMLFYGRPGTGKTTCVDLLARAIFATKALRERCVLRLNASDERGIGAVRTRIKTFCDVAPPSEAPFKLVVLDECDNMTQVAQFALRRMMEADVSSTALRKPRFILMCNYLSRIIAPIASRCSQVRFEPIAIDKIAAHLDSVAKRERWSSVSQATLHEVARVASGDMRSALTLLQSLLRLWGNEACPERVPELVGDVPREIVDALLRACMRKSVRGVTAHVRALVHREAYSAEAIFRALLPLVLQCDALSEKNRALVSIKVAKAEHAFKKSADEFFQVLSVAIYVRKLHQSQ